MFGEHKSHYNPPWSSQYEYLADTICNDHVYGKNAVVSKGHYSNAILFKYPIVYWEHEEIYAITLGQRGLLNCNTAFGRAFVLHLCTLAYFRTGGGNSSLE